ncbi:hypothetical protein NI389_18595 (plasmid) [Pseudoalteromonas xiamenensis]|uniref:hypothetical protein n=1 Tax=Pseudoalteromonas xiamenensis TaxID=882626 RepID=UPI0027E48BA2|nr:hypothetical protein [Pseudoalteromonas xiamenensis]WMN61818.1 hypothetical protein NI389_18595 [Pseudoalteromonas xiamenensis]
MNILALIIGILVAIFIVIRFPSPTHPKKSAYYPILLATFPLYYVVFALSVLHIEALVQEALYALWFVIPAILALKFSARPFLLLLGAAYLGHAVYDAYHEQLFINNGTPTWWPEFCGAVDGLLGLFILYKAWQRHQAEKRDA